MPDFTTYMNQIRAFKRPKFERSDIMAGLTTGIANVPDGMASAALAGVSPVHGIYTLIVGTPLASLSISTKLMMFNTTSAMTLVAVDGLGSRSGTDRVQALIVIALVAGVFQIVLGLLGLGMLTKFVPNAVMTGFLTGIGTMIILGQLWDLTGYSDDLGGSRLEKTARLLANLNEIDPWTTAVGVGTIVVMVLLSRGKFANFNLLIGLAAATIVSVIASPDSLALVSTSLGDIPRGLPQFSFPRLGLIPTFLFAGIAVSVVGLLQAAGVAQAYPNPDGSETSDSRDFLGQGIANTAGSFFGSMAGGGSLSGTALLVSAGARSRLAGVVQAGVVLVVILIFGGVLGRIPMSALAALLIYAAVLSFKFDTIQTVRRTSKISLATMSATFLAALVVPLQQAVVLGVVFAAVLFIYKASLDVQLTEMFVEGEHLRIGDAPETLRSNAVTILNIEGNLFYAGSRTLSRNLPSARSVERPVVVLRLRGQRELGSTFFKVIAGYAGQIRDEGGRLILAGVEPSAMARLKRTGLLGVIGAENVFEAGHILGESVIDAERAGRAWLKKNSQGPIEVVLDTELDQSADASPTDDEVSI